jgi:two-component system sensor histidine kinase KdpD
VHIIAVGGERPPRVHQRRQTKRVTWPRQILATIVMLLLMPSLTIVMSQIRSSLSPSTVFLVYLIAILALTTWAGVIVGVLSAIFASALENYYFVKPLHTLEVARPDDVVAIVAFLLFAVAASVIVNRFAQSTHEADRARAEAQILAGVAASVASSHEDLQPLLESLRTVFAASSVALVVEREGQWVSDLVSGEAIDVFETGSFFEIDDEHRLYVIGATLSDQDNQLVSAFARRVAAGLRSQIIARDATQLQEIAEAESLRLALFRTASKELLGPLEKVRANTSLLAGSHERRSLDERNALLAGIDSQVRQLTRLVVNLIDAGRLEAGEVSVHPESVLLNAALTNVVNNIDTRGRIVECDVPSDLPALRTDPILLQRVIGNIVSNACRFGPADKPVTIKVGVVGDYVQLLVVDQGPGMPVALREAVLAPFDRLRGAQLNAGLNLTVASGFTQLLGGRLLFEDTPGGGLTVAVDFPMTAQS